MTVVTRNADRQRELLNSAKVIAVVGHSDKPWRTSYNIANYLRQVGYRVYAVNPEIEGVNGEPSYPSLADVPEPIDIVNVFRRSEHLPGVVDEAIAVGAKVVWAQLGVHHPDAVQKAEEAGIDIVTDTCIKVAHMQLI